MAEKVSQAEYDLRKYAADVWNGDYGVGEDRKRRLTELGINYDTVQAQVNKGYGLNTQLSLAKLEVDPSLPNPGIQLEIVDEQTTPQATDSVNLKIESPLDDSLTPEQLDILSKRAVRGDFGKGAIRDGLLGEHSGAVNRQIEQWRRQGTLDNLDYSGLPDKGAGVEKFDVEKQIENTSDKEVDEPSRKESPATDLLRPNGGAFEQPTFETHGAPYLPKADLVEQKLSATEKPDASVDLKIDLFAPENIVDYLENFTDKEGMPEHFYDVHNPWKEELTTSQKQTLLKTTLRAYDLVDKHDSGERKISTKQYDAAIKFLRSPEVAAVRDDKKLIDGIGKISKPNERKKLRELDTDQARELLKDTKLNDQYALDVTKNVSFDKSDPDFDNALNKADLYQQNANVSDIDNSISMT